MTISTCNKIFKIFFSTLILFGFSPRILSFSTISNCDSIQIYYRGFDHRGLYPVDANYVINVKKYFAGSVLDKTELLEFESTLPTEGSSWFCHNSSDVRFTVLCFKDQDSVIYAIDKEFNLVFNRKRYLLNLSFFKWTTRYINSESSYLTNLLQSVESRIQRNFQLVNFIKADYEALQLLLKDNDTLAIQEFLRCYDAKIYDRHIKITLFFFENFSFLKFLFSMTTKAEAQKLIEILKVDNYSFQVAFAQYDPPCSLTYHEILRDRLLTD